MFKTIKLAALAALLGTAAAADDTQPKLDVAALEASQDSEILPLHRQTAAGDTVIVSELDGEDVIVEEILSVYVIGKGITLTN